MAKKHELEKIPHLFTDKHIKLIKGLIGWLEPEVIVEVGAYFGYCSVHMAKVMPEEAQIYIIDNFSLGNDPSTVHNILTAYAPGKEIYMIQGDSKTVQWPGKVDFAFIDGDHSYAGCKRDCEKAFSLGAQCVVVHDTVGWWGPRQYVDELPREKFHVLEGYHDSGLAVIMPRNPKPAVQYSQEEYPEGIVNGKSNLH